MIRSGMGRDVDLEVNERVRKGLVVEGGLGEGLEVSARERLEVIRRIRIVVVAGFQVVHVVVCDRASARRLRPEERRAVEIDIGAAQLRYRRGGGTHRHGETGDTGESEG